MKNSKKSFSALIAFGLALVLSISLGISALAGSTTGSLSSDEVNALLNTTTNKAEVTSPIIEVSKKAQESVVGINNYQIKSRNQFGNLFGFPFEQSPSEPEQERKEGSGSGTVISPYGHVLTNYHVVENASRVTVTVGERELQAAVVGTDSELDIAVLLVPGLDLPAIPLGDSDQIQVGEYAIVVGNPLGQQFERSVTLGIVSAVARTMTSTSRDRYGLRSEKENQMIQVDAAISSGNSGGGLFNTLGQLQGVPTLKLVDGNNPFMPSNRSVDNIGMCVPINAAKPLIRTVLERYNAAEVEAEAEKVRKEEASQAQDKASPRPRMGISVDSVGRYLSASQGLVPQGALVVKVEENSPAQVAGLQPGDIIVEVNSQVISDHSQLIEQLREMKAGDSVQLKIYRLNGLLDLLRGQLNFDDLGKGAYQNLTVELKILDKTDM